MMWLMGLAGLVGAGAASFVVTKTDIETDEDENAQGGDPMDAPDLTDGNMLDMVDSLWDDPGTTAETPTFDESDDYLYDMFDTPAPAPDFGDAQITDTDIEGMTTWPGHEGPEPEMHDLTLAGADSPFAADDDLHEAPAAAPFPDTTEAEPVAASSEAPVMLGDWITQGMPSEPVDYDPGADSLVVVWDDLEGESAEPDVGVEPDPFDPEVMHVTMNGSSVAEIYGEPELASQDLTVIPLSSAMIAGLEPA